MALTLAYAYHVPKSLHTFFFHMIQDWIITASTVRHAWQSILNAGWRKIIPITLAIFAVLFYQQSSEATKDALLGQCDRRCASLSGDSMPVEAWVRQLYYDGTGRPDYASYEAGGTVVYELTSQTYVRDERMGRGKPWSWWKDADPHERPQRLQPPAYAIYPEVHPGACWAMRGSRGSLGIMLARPAAISAFTIDHAPKSMTLDPGATPRSGELWGLTRENMEYSYPPRSKLSVLNSSAMFQKVGLGAQAKRHYGNYNFVKLGTFAYDWNNYIPFQTFRVPSETIATLGDIHFDTVLLVVLDNWGSEDFTCLYRVRIHPK